MMMMKGCRAVAWIVAAFAGCGIVAAGGAAQFAVGEGRLVQLDGNGAPLRSPSNVLTRIAAAEPDRSGQPGAWGPAGADLPRTLEAHRWRLDSVTDGAGKRIEAVFPATGRAFTFAFSGSRVLVEGGCNSMRGDYRVAADGRLEFGRMAATMMACAPALMQADAALSKLLAAPLQVAMAGGAQPQLRLVTAANETMVLIGQPTPEALYGAGTLMFLEVAAFRVPCRHPLTPEATCLQVRERKYDERGLPVGTPGEWRPFYGSIEGYTHTEGERNVLRVKRFQRSQVPADASSFVYVLDLKVESEIVPRR
jgi:heat shock protein HslJ